MGITVITPHKTKVATIGPATAKTCLIVFSFPDTFRRNSMCRTRYALLSPGAASWMAGGGHVFKENRTTFEAEESSQISTTHYFPTRFPDVVSLGCILARLYTTRKTSGITMAAFSQPPRFREPKLTVVTKKTSMQIPAKMLCMCALPFLSIGRNGG
jgi:hypothetical protein